MAGNAVETARLSVTYRSNRALCDASLQVPLGASTAVVGPNGAGKSTLLKAIVAVVPYAGSVRVLGRELGQVRAEVAYVAQSDVSLAQVPLTVRELVRMGRVPRLGWLRRFGREDHRAVDQAMEATGVAGFADAAVGELSGGQRRRAVVARALAQEAKVLLLDEPFAGIDATTSMELLDTLVEVGRDPRRAVVVVHHDLAQARRFDRAVVVSGRVVSDGPSQTALDQSVLASAFGIPA